MVEERIECGRMIARFIRGPEGSQIVRMASANDWKPMYDSIEPFRDAMMRSRKETIAQKIVTYDFARLMQGATEVSTSAFGDALIRNL